MDFLGPQNDLLERRYGRAAPLVQAACLIAGHALAIALLAVPIIVPILFKAWTENGGHFGTTLALLGGH